MKRYFDTFGAMVDMSRNAVMNLKRLKELMSLLREMGYNSIMLYTEDTYEVDGEPYFGYMRGRYSKAEMKEIDAYGKQIGMEVIPCIQTLAHLNATLRWGQIPVDCNDILLTDDDRTYELIDRMFATLSECYSSRKIHVGMDEAHMLGRGKHLDRFGYETVPAIMKRHLAKVCEIGKKYGYEIMLWSDMFFRSWNGGKYYIPECRMPEEIVKAVPGNVTPVLWDYSSRKESFYGGMIENHKQLSERTCFAGGAWCWEGVIPYNRYTIKGMTEAIRACKNHGVRSFFVTMWGDDGAECSRFSVLPSLFWLAEQAKGNTDPDAIRKKFRAKYGIGFDEFLQIDDPNRIEPDAETKVRNPSKYMLYADCFNDFLDYTVKPGVGEIYARYAENLHETAKKSRRFGYLFDTAAKLCDALTVKYELGLKTRRAYENGEKEVLRSLAENDYTAAMKRIGSYAKALEKQWMRDNKPQGFDVHDLRFGGLLRRLNVCKRRILDFVNGKTDRIPELEEKLLPYGEKEVSKLVTTVQSVVTVNVL